MCEEMFSGYQGKNFNKLEALLNNESPRKVARNLAAIILNSDASNDFDRQRPVGQQVNGANIANRLEQIFQNDVQSCELAKKLCNILNQNTVQRQELGRNPYEGNHSLLYKLERIYLHEPPDQRFQNQLLRFISSNQDQDLNDTQAASYLTQILQAYLGEYTHSNDQQAGGITTALGGRAQQRQYRDYFWEAHPHLNRLQNRYGRVSGRQTAYAPVLEIIHEEVLNLNQETPAENNQETKSRNVLYNSVEPPSVSSKKLMDAFNHKNKISTSKTLSQVLTENNGKKEMCSTTVNNKAKTNTAILQKHDNLLLSPSIPKICCEPRPKQRNLVKLHSDTRMCGQCAEKNNRFLSQDVPKIYSEQCIRTVNPVPSRDISKAQSDQSLMKNRTILSNNFNKSFRKLPKQWGAVEIAKRNNSFNLEKSLGINKCSSSTDNNELKILQANMDVKNYGAESKEYLLNKTIPGVNSSVEFRCNSEIKKNNNANGVKQLNTENTERFGNEQINYDDLPSCSFKKPNMRF